LHQAFQVRQAQRAEAIFGMHLFSSVVFALEALALASSLPPSAFAYSHTLEVFL
jgi:hypothetical protein